MTTRILCGRVGPGYGDAVNWPMEGILNKVAPCFCHLEKGTLNIKLDGEHTLRPDFKLSKEERSDRGTRPEDLSFECCHFVTGTVSLKALIARTSTNYHGDRVLEIMAEENLRKYFGLKDGHHVHVEVWVEADG